MHKTSGNVRLKDSYRNPIRIVMNTVEHLTVRSKVNDTALKDKVVNTG